MKLSCVQMDMAFSNPAENFERAALLIKEAAKANPDVILLPEMFNLGFFPRENLQELSDNDGEKTKEIMSALARELSVNIVAGSVANNKEDGVYNTAYVFSSSGEVIGEYDKTHLFSPMGEDKFFKKGNSLCSFTIDGVKCGILICYDIRFPELTRSLTVNGIDVLFLVAQWPNVRIPHLHALCKARAIENQMFVACCNSCGKAGETVYGGSSVIFNPWGELLCSAKENEEIIFADCDMSIIKNIRETINVFADRRTELYNIK